jgi:DNA mismatch repair protein MutS2
VENSVREIRESQAEKEIIKKVKTKIEAQKKKLAVHKKESAPEKHVELNHSLREGDWVKWKNHAGIGKIVGTADNKDRVFVQYNDFRIQVPCNQLIPAVNPEKKKRASRSRHPIDFQVSPEISVRGMVVEEALQEVDGYLDKAAMSGLTEVRIIHGKGEGILRKEIGKHLENHPFVKKKRLGRYREGDTGVTIVELK